VSAAVAAAVLVNVAQLLPNAVLDIRYATQDNFLGQAVYERPECWLRPKVAERLAKVQADAEKKGLRLMIFDCYRPLSVQKKLWELKPDENFVAPPSRGSRHNRGAAVDVGLADKTGKALRMPTGFDDFTERAHRSYKGADPEALENRRLLESLMEKRGFVGLDTEWWHFDAKDWRDYPLLDVPFPR
jgi:zinc D-Ala-D-Ala dipeptidase